MPCVLTLGAVPMPTIACAVPGPEFSTPFEPEALSRCMWRAKGPIWAAVRMPGGLGGVVGPPLGSEVAMCARACVGPRLWDLVSDGSCIRVFESAGVLGWFLSDVYA